MSDVTIPKARVWPKPDGTLRFNQWEGARRPDDDGWWDDVLRDPRAKAPTDTYISNEHHARWQLDRRTNGSSAPVRVASIIRWIATS